VERLEHEIDEYSATIEPLHAFVLPRGRPGGAALHIARTVCRRAERELWTLNRTSPLPDELLRWLNRMSDLLFALALSVNRADGFAEVAPDYSV
jgi:cob(I)alamin adenosyltransferase